MAIEVTVDIADLITVCVATDAPYSPDVAEDLLRRTREAAITGYTSLPDANEADVEP